MLCLIPLTEVAETAAAAEFPGPRSSKQQQQKQTPVKAALTAAAAANLLFLNAPRGFRLFTVLPALAWAGRVASAFLQPLTDIKRRILVVYPVILFYVAVSAIICAI